MLLSGGWIVACAGQGGGVLALKNRTGMSTHECAPISFDFDNSYAASLDGFYVPWESAKVPSPRLLQFNHGLAEELGLNSAALDTEVGASIFSGNTLPEGSAPLAQAYAGHQFGGFSAQLGDGRALLLGELIDKNGQRRDIQLKGSGRTPFSRGGDGKAAIGPVLREYLISEAMHALGIPTTRALAAVATGEIVQRERPLPGAILTRVAASHIRVGTFQFFASRGEVTKVRQLADYAIDRHYRDAKEAQNPYLALFERVRDAQAKLIAGWMHVGFIHGVMNTDNMTVSGETIDYGPCAFLDTYSPSTVFSSIDEQGRYAFGNQPGMAQWNLTRLAESFIGIIHSDQEEAIGLLTDAVNIFPSIYQHHWLAGMRSKIGLVTADERDLEIVHALLTAMEEQNADYTTVFRRLSGAVETSNHQVRDLFDDPAAFNQWADTWRDRSGRETIAPQDRATAMDSVNPIYIPRNHLVEAALTAAVDQQNLEPFGDLLNVVKDPFHEIEGNETFAQPAPDDWGTYRTYCGT